MFEVPLARSRKLQVAALPAVKHLVTASVLKLECPREVVRPQPQLVVLPHCVAAAAEAAAAPLDEESAIPSDCLLPWRSPDALLFNVEGPATEMFELIGSKQHGKPEGIVTMQIAHRSSVSL